MRPRHLALPARLCAGSAGLANAFGVGSALPAAASRNDAGVARRLRIAFRSTAFSPKSDARTPAHGGQAVRTPKVPRLRYETQRAKICASSPRRVRSEERRVGK